MSKKFPIVLIIDDSKAFRTFFVDVIKKTVKWVRIFEAENGIEGIKLFQKYNPDLILLDIKMPKIEGGKVLEFIMEKNVNVKIIMTTAYADDQKTINQLIKMGAFSFIPKPMNRMTLMKTVTDALYNGKISGTHNQISKSIVLEQN